MCGKLPFVWFSKSVTQASGSIVASAGLIGQVDIPKSLFPVSIIQEGLYKQSAVFLLLICVVLSYGITPSSAWIALIPIILTQYLMILACGLIGAILVCFMKDFSMLISLGMIFLMFVSGVFFDVRDLPNPEIVNLILLVNPLAFILDAYRQVLMTGSVPDAQQLIIIAVCFSTLIFAAVLFLRKKSQAIALRAITA